MNAPDSNPQGHPLPPRPPKPLDAMKLVMKAAHQIAVAKGEKLIGVSTVSGRVRVRIYFN